jgi:hypothetical protein
MGSTHRLLYKADHKSCHRFPIPGNETLKAGVSRNFQVFEPLDFIAEITQHIPEPRAHTIRYYGYYSNKSRGMRAKATAIANADQKDESDPANTVTHRQARSRWAALIKRVYEVDPLCCPRCGEQMRIISFIEARDQATLIKDILRHCGLWKEPESRAPPVFALDYEYVSLDEVLKNL